MGIKLVRGWGVNDVSHQVQKFNYVDGKVIFVWICPYYRCWKSMIDRCFSEKYHKNCPTYKGCTICEDWKYLSNFIKWVDSQPNKDWQSCQLDKDFLLDGCRHYSEKTCAFMHNSLNKFITDSRKSRGKYMIGAYPVSSGYGKNPYTSSIRDPFNKKSKYLGVFQTELEAHKAWQAKKHEYACQLADLQTDPRVADALRQRYAPDKDWTNK